MRKVASVTLACGLAVAGACAALAEAVAYADLGDKTGQVNDFWNTGAHTNVATEVEAATTEIGLQSFALSEESVVAPSFDSLWRLDLPGVFLRFRVDFPKGIVIVIQ